MSEFKRKLKYNDTDAKIVFTQGRVKNVLKEIPSSAGRKYPKMRETLKNTFSGMGNLIGQLRDEYLKTKLSYAESYVKKKRHNHLIQLAIICVIIIMLLLLIVIILYIF